MITYSLRPATAEEAPYIRKLVWGAHLNPSGLDWRRFWVAVDDQNQVIGCVQIKPHKDGSDELASLVVDPAYSGMGIARALVEHLIGIYDGTLYLMCRATLGEFYQRFGFKAVLEPQMPPYFRRIAKLASLVEIMSKAGETLLIMKR